MAYLEIPDMPDADEDEFQWHTSLGFDARWSRNYLKATAQCLIFMWFEDKSHKEIASMLGITEHTSSSQFYRAKNLLIKKINNYRKKELQ